MGCKSTKPDTFNIETEYRNKNLTMPDKSLFENEFEKEAYMTINVLRTDPKLLIPLIRDVKGNVSRVHSTIFKLIMNIHAVYREQTIQRKEVELTDQRT